MNDTYVIAEIGSNHAGSSAIAMQLIDSAASAGFSAIKMQHFKPEDLYPEKFVTAPMRFNCLRREAYKELADYARSLGLDFGCSLFSAEDLEYFSTFLDFIKIASIESRDLDFVAEVADLGMKTIISSGFSTHDYFDNIISAFYDGYSGTHPLTILHCIGEYPAPIEQINMKYLDIIKYTYAVQHNRIIKYGFSDHTIGNIAAICAICKGASIIEKHIGTDSYTNSPDWSFSLKESDFNSFIGSIRDAEACLGTMDRKVTPEEVRTSSEYDRVVYSTVDIEPGVRISEDMITKKRRAGCKSYLGTIYSIYDVRNKKTKNKIYRDEPIYIEDIHEY